MNSHNHSVGGRLCVLLKMTLKISGTNYECYLTPSLVL